MKISKEYKIFQKYISDENLSFFDYVYLFFQIPLNIIESLLRYFPGGPGILLRRCYYKLILKHVGKKVIIDEGVYFVGKNIILEDYCYIDKFCILNSVTNIRVGKRTHIAPYCSLHSGYNSKIDIGSNIAIAAYTGIYSSSNSLKKNLRMGGPVCLPEQKYVKSGDIILEDEVFIGLSSMILPNVKIKYGAVVAAGSVVNFNLEKLGVYDRDCKLKFVREFDSKLFES